MFPMFPKRKTCDVDSSRKAFGSLTPHLSGAVIPPSPCSSAPHAKLPSNINERQLQNTVIRRTNSAALPQHSLAIWSTETRASTTSSLKILLCAAFFGNGWCFLILSSYIIFIFKPLRSYVESEKRNCL